MIRVTVVSVLVAALVVLASTLQPVLAQSDSEIETLKGEVETLKEGQAAMQKNLEEILDILEPLRRRAEARNRGGEFEPKDIDLAGAAVKGAADAPVTLVEFTDYQCPFCRRHFSSTLPQIVQNYVESGKLRYVIKEFPIPSLHPAAPQAAEGALCAGDQDQYWEMHDAIFQNPRAVAPEQLKDKATELGLDVAAFSDCIDSNKYREKVRADMTEGRQLGVSGTPSFFIGPTDLENPDKITATKFIRGAQDYTTFRSAIEEVLSTPKQGT